MEEEHEIPPLPPLAAPILYTQTEDLTPKKTQMEETESITEEEMLDDEVIRAAFEEEE